MNEEITLNMVLDPKCASKVLQMVLERDINDWVSRFATEHPNCPPEALKMVLERGKSDAISRYTAENPNCPPEALQMVLERDKDDGVSWYAAKNPNCPPQARLKWLMAVGKIKTPDLSKHDIQVIKDYNKPDEEWEQFKKMVEDE